MSESGTRPRSGHARPGDDQGAGSLRAMSAAGPVPVAAPAAPAPPQRPRSVRPVPLDEVAAVVAEGAGAAAGSTAFATGSTAFATGAVSAVGAVVPAADVPSAPGGAATAGDRRFGAQTGQIRPHLHPTVDQRGGPGPVITGVTLRASDIRPGDLFAALPGARAHGVDFAAEALARGAVAVLTDAEGAHRLPAATATTRAEGADGRDLDASHTATAGVPLLVHPRPRDVLGAVAAHVYGDPTAHLSVIGVTGTSGKTTVTHLIEAGLAAAGRTAGRLGTVGIRVDGQPLPSSFTTPEAPDLQALFAIMREAGVTDVAMEVSSHALALGRVAGTRFAVGAFTNL